MWLFASALGDPLPSNSLSCSSSLPSIFLFLPGSLEIHPIKCNLAKSLPSKEVPGIKIRVRQRESKPCKTLLLSRRPWVACLEIMHTTCRGPLEVSPILLCGLTIELPIAEKHHHLIKLPFKCCGFFIIYVLGTSACPPIRAPSFTTCAETWGLVASPQQKLLKLGAAADLTRIRERGGGDEVGKCC